MAWTKNTALRELKRLTSEIDRLAKDASRSADHVRWIHSVVSVFEEVFGPDSRYLVSFGLLSWVRRGTFLVGGLGDPAGSINPQAAIKREHHEAYLEDLQTARGLLFAAYDELQRKGLEAVYEGESATEGAAESSSGGKKRGTGSLAVADPLKDLHPEIYEKCHKLYEKCEFAEAVEKSFKVVRDRLRKLTGYETGSDAFGKGKLYIKGAAASNVDQDFNEAVKFLTMAIDRFRNEKSHTSDARIDDPVRAREYLSMSSLAMRLLDTTEIRP